MSKTKRAESGDESIAKKAKLEESAARSFSSDATTKDGKKWNLKIVCWNVNGIRAWKGKDGMSIFDNEDPDIVCFQETKCSKLKIPSEVKRKGYKSYFMEAVKEGYSGVGFYSKKEPMNVTYGFKDKEHDKEGRLITAEYEHFFVVTAYVPNSGRGLVTLDKRMDWDIKFFNHLKTLDAKKPVIMCGDLNVAHNEIDLTNPKSNKKNAGFTKEERDGFSKLLKEGNFVDSYRELYPDKTAAYTFWSYMANARAKNIGWRLDYFVLSDRLKENLCDSLIRHDVMGSDHCPVTLLLHMPQLEDKDEE